mmetsp:Transcript_10739/g.17601  ORF Transcript_10739/g.17601 Transcript_10739/m.17601 type:complete len:290 (-) Transcript_10739:80-949(-)|eukprot:CAMPEP_0203788066 /NCGR_PEP_ID=MMETSP0100_2-20121128/2619_1 /ASSEMBLY_ACC=CAM_ASM_000210 /TAXON_ID=96639 /ORGANISM=" , Strain NY0313808BC1" /LENGTH=289 /DNA_ID=CAMNT_0050690725 /DNA_START=265 /DNA_END=1134 /DNA_ORIENTATION=-
MDIGDLYRQVVDDVIVRLQGRIAQDKIETLEKVWMDNLERTGCVNDLSKFCIREEPRNVHENKLATNQDGRPSEKFNSNMLNDVLMSGPHYFGCDAQLVQEFSKANNLTKDHVFKTEPTPLTTALSTTAPARAAVTRRQQKQTKRRRVTQDLLTSETALERNEVTFPNPDSDSDYDIAEQQVRQTTRKRIQQEKDDRDALALMMPVLEQDPEVNEILDRPDYLGTGGNMSKNVMVAWNSTCESKTVDTTWKLRLHGVIARFRGVETFLDSCVGVVAYAADDDDKKYTDA